MKTATALLLAAATMTAGTAHAYVRTTTDKNAQVRWPRSCVVVTAVGRASLRLDISNKSRPRMNTCQRRHF